MSDSRDIWKDYNDRQEFEHDLINRKTTWWLSTQTILFAAYGVTLSDKILPEPLATLAINFRKIVGFVGLAVALATFIGILAVINSKWISWREYKEFFEKNSKEYPLPEPLKALNKKVTWGVNTINTCVSLTPDVLLPVIFFAAWYCVVIQDLTWLSFIPIFR
jgi:hypothetical protein